jgi:hypothetical protein
MKNGIGEDGEGMESSGPAINKKDKITKLDAKKLNLQDAINALNKLDVDEGHEEGYTVNYLSSKIHDFIADDGLADMMFSETYTRQADINFLLPYSINKGLFCFKRVSQEYTNLVVVKDEKASSSLLNMVN